MVLSQALLKRLAVLTVAVYGGGGDAVAAVSSELSAVEPDVLTALLEPSEIDAFESRSRPRILRLVALDQRPALRRYLAENLGRYELPPGPDARGLLEALAHDSSPVVQRTMAVQLGMLLERWPLFDRMELIADWSLSSDTELRLAMARALCRPVAAWGVRTALQLLSQDDDSWVRQAALSAARLRGVALS